MVSLLSINPCNTDFSDALGDRRIEEIQPPRFAGASPRKGHEGDDGNCCCSVHSFHDAGSRCESNAGFALHIRRPLCRLRSGDSLS
ncbi:TPA: hypothetical protein L5674_006579 [Pseudomonas aeruginosa]|nr:hypothetical protein [Pseudomonas aeruginosa]